MRDYTNKAGGRSYAYDDGFDHLELTGRGRRAYKSLLCGTCHKPGFFIKIGEIVEQWERNVYDGDDAWREDYDPDEVEECYKTEQFCWCPHCDREWLDYEEECGDW